MTQEAATVSRVPGWVSIFNRPARFLLRAGVPMGPNALLTIRGRTSGLPRTTPVAIIEHSGRRWVWSPWGEVHWVRNLRAAGTATISVGGRTEEVRATELDREERIRFFTDVLVSVARSTRLGVLFIRIADGVDLNRPVDMAQDRRVFELHPAA
ncbi:MAG: nitroreductase family deazaflavin-dependent oxidoreductase [Chloroflexota bacterium]